MKIEMMPYDFIYEGYKRERDSQDEFVSRCLTNLIGIRPFLNYNVEYCFTKEQAEAVVRGVKKSSMFDSTKYTIKYSYDKENEFYEVVLKKKFKRPTAKQLAKFC